MKTLFAGYHLSGPQLNSRIVMAPMARSRAVDTVPNDETALYYAQSLFPVLSADTFGYVVCLRSSTPLP